jgi:hypothetical protein
MGDSVKCLLQKLKRGWICQTLDEVMHRNIEMDGSIYILNRDG